MEGLKIFLIGGCLSLVGQFLMDVLKRSMFQVMSIFIVAGAVIEGFYLYEPLRTIGGAAIEVSLFHISHVLMHPNPISCQSFLLGEGLFFPPFLTITVIMSILTALLFKPKG